MERYSWDGTDFTGVKTCPVNGHRKTAHHSCKVSAYRLKICIMTAICICLLAAAASLLYFLLNGKPSATDVVALPHKTDWIPRCPNADEHSSRFDCYPENADVDRELCILRGCCFQEDVGRPPQVRPKCVYPKNHGYVVAGDVSVSNKGYEIPLKRMQSPSRYGDDIQVANVLIEMQTSYRLRIKIYDPISDRYEVPAPQVPHESGSDSYHTKNVDRLYSVVFNKSSSPFTFKVLRKDTQSTLFDTSAGALTLSHHFLELSSFLPSDKLYGLDGATQRVLAGPKTAAWSLFADPALKAGGIHPMYICVESNGTAHGLLLLNSNVIEMTLLPFPAVTLRTIGGILDFYLFLGPTPDDVARQYTEAVGRTLFPPYWSLGVHAGGVRSKATAKDLKSVVKYFQEKNISLDVLHLGYDALDLYSADLEEVKLISDLSSELHSKGQKLILLARPGAKANDSLSWRSAHKLGLKQGAFITDKWGAPLQGRVNGYDISYAVFGAHSGTQWWTEILSKVCTDVQFDGLSMSDNQPYSEIDGGVNGCLNDDLNRPPYIPPITGTFLYSQTLCMDAFHSWENRNLAHYDVHNLYSYMMITSTHKAVSSFSSSSKKLLLSDWSYVGSGHYSGQWIRDLQCSWHGLQSSVPAVLGYSLYGIPLVGVDMCRNSENALLDEELCLRVLQLTLYYPVASMFGSESAKACMFQPFGRQFFESVNEAVLHRYKLLPHFYTLFYLSHTEGLAVVKPLAAEFPDDENVHKVKSQFLWGSSLLVSPVTEKNIQYLEIYLPKGIWYDFHTGEAYYSKSEWLSEAVSLYDYRRSPIVHLRGGNIVVLQEPANTTESSRQKPMKLLVALNSSYEASGVLFWDDGNTAGSIHHGEYIIVQFVVSKNILKVTGTLGSKLVRSDIHGAFIEHVCIMGFAVMPKKVVVDDSYIVPKKQRQWNATTKVLDIRHVLIPLESSTELKWYF